MFDQICSRWSRPPAARSTTSVAFSIKARLASSVASAIFFNIHKNATLWSSCHKIQAKG